MYNFVKHNTYISIMIVVPLILCEGFATYRNPKEDKGMAENRTMFRLQLSTQASKLLSETEEKYGKSVREEEVKDLDGFGQSEIDKDGTPVIRINPSKGRTESTIVHELFHLKLRSEGWPNIGYLFTAGDNTDSNIQFLKWIDANLYDAILHWLFYPQMSTMEVNPNAEEKAQFEQSLRADKYEGLNPATERESLALYYLKAHLEVNDRQLLVQITDWYKRKEWFQPLRIGEVLIQLVKEANPRTPEDSISVFLKCINFLLQGTARFALDKWMNLTCGSITQRVAVIRVLPPN